jgi:F0F1-type ATP synthase assembly protein I
MPYVSAENPNPWKKRGEDMRRLSRGLAIPSLMLGGPVGGALIGYFVGGWVGSPQQGIVIGVLAGLFIAIFEVVRLLRQMSAEQDRDRRNRE